MQKKKIPPLIVEYFADTSNSCFISLIEYKREQYVGVIDNITDTELSAYILSHAKPENISVEDFLKLVVRWFYKSSEKYPLSFEMTRLGITNRTQPLYKIFELGYISRVVGKPFMFKELNASTKIKRRRILPLPEYVEIKFKKASPNEN
jgi:hypothetical protein